MGIKSSSSRLLCWLKRKEIFKMDSVLTLGKLKLYMKPRQIRKLVRDYGDVLSTKEINDVETFFKALGSKEIHALDYSDFEGADIIHDLNCPIPEALREKFDCIVDGGTSEHIFNFPQNIMNIMEMIKVGGFYLGTLPTNNWSGHGFYQFSPVLFIQLFSEINNFKIYKIFYCTSKDTSKLYEIVNIDSTKRIEINYFLPTEVFVVAKKIGPTPKIINLQQMDYVERWNNIPTKPLKVNILWQIYNKITPFLSQDVRVGFLKMFEKNIKNKVFLKKIRI